MAKEERDITTPLDIQVVMAGLNKRFGQNMVRKGSEMGPMIPRVPTGSLTLDWGLGGGFPVGRIGEFHGYESSGKSLMGLNLIKRFQQAYPKSQVGWVDIEGSWDPQWVRAIGIDPNKVYFSQPDTGNQAFDIIEQWVRTCEFSFIVLDSLGMASAQQEIERSMEEYEVGVKARMVNKAVRKLQSAMNFSKRYDQEPSILFLNHTYLDLGGFKPKKTTPGGRGKNYAVSARVEFSVSEELYKPDGDEDQYGIRVDFAIHKNKVGVPNRAGQFDLVIQDHGRYHPGDITRREYTAFMIDAGIIEQSGAWYKVLSGPHKGERFQGINAVEAYLEEMTDEQIERTRQRCLATWGAAVDEPEEPAKKKPRARAKGRTKK